MMNGIILLVVSLWPCLLYGQNNASVGQVLALETKTPISFCHVRIMNTTQGVLTDSDGKFSLLLPANTTAVHIIVSSVGYDTDTFRIESAQHRQLFYLKATEHELEEIVITGTSHGIALKYNPVSVAIVSPAAIERTIENNVIDVLVKNAPGLNAVKTGPNISKPFIRGLGYNRVLTLYDGIRQEGQQWGDEHGIEVDGYNIEKAEVIKGPASLTFGSDALAGVVSMFSWQPKEKDGKIRGRFISEYQSNNGLIGNGIRIYTSKEHWYWVGNGSSRKARNYGNRIDGRVYNTGFDEKNVSVAGGYRGNKGNSHMAVTLYDNLQGIPDGSRDSLTRAFTKQVQEGAEDDVKTRPIVSRDELDSYRLSPLHQHIQHYRIYSNHHYQLGRGDADFLLAMQQNVRREYNHPTQPEQAGMFVQLNTVNYGFRYNAPELNHTEISVGINGMYQHNSNKNATDFPIPDYTLSDGGVYGFAAWRKDRWAISGGTRYDLRYIHGNDFYVEKDSVKGFNRRAYAPDISHATLQFPALHQMFRGISLSAGAAYDINETLSVKVNLARGYRAPNISEIASNGLDPGAHILYIGNRDFTPEFSFQQDIGLTASFHNVAASLSVFNNSIQHYIYLSQLVNAQGDTPVLSHGNKTFQYRQGSARLYGMEASFTFHPASLSGLNINSNLSMVFGNNTGPEFTGKGIYGNYLPFIPPVKLLSTIRYEMKMKSTVFTSVAINGDVDWSASQNHFLALYHTETMTPSYALVNAGVSAEINCSPRTKIQLLLQVNNLLDKVYQSNLSRLKYFEYYSSSPSGYRGMYGMGRNICLKAIIPF